MKWRRVRFKGRSEAGALGSEPVKITDVRNGEDQDTKDIDDAGSSQTQHPR